MSTQGERLSTFLKASWGAGSIGTTSMLYLVNLFLVFFLVRHVGIDAAVAGTLMAFTRFYDAIIDPLIGTLSDRTTSRWGRRRPWLLAGAILCPLAIVAVFNPPADWSGTALNAWVLGALLLYLSAYSIYAIPYTALGAELTDDYRERGSVMAWRTFFVYCSGVIVAAGAPALVALLGKDRAAYSTMSLAAALVVAASMLWVVFNTAGARKTVRAKEPLPLGLWWRTTLSNVPFLLILLTKMTLQLGTAFAGASALFFMSDVLARGEGAFALWGLVANLVGIATVPLWGWALNRVERRPFFIAMLVVNGLCALSWLLATPGEPMAAFVLRAIVSGASGSGAVLVAMTMLTDAIEYDRLRTGQRREGLFVGGFELIQTTSFVVGPLVVGFAFSAAGLVPGQVAAGAQPASAIEMIRIAYSVIPGACCACGILLLCAYRLTRGRLESMRDAAAAARPTGAEALAASGGGAIR